MDKEDYILLLIEKYQLAQVVDHIMPIGCVMAGEIEKFWRKK